MCDSSCIRSRRDSPVVAWMIVLSCGWRTMLNHSTKTPEPHFCLERTMCWCSQYVFSVCPFVLIQSTTCWHVVIWKLLFACTERWHGGHPRLPFPAPNCRPHDTEVDAQSADEWQCGRARFWEKVQLTEPILRINSPWYTVDSLKIVQYSKDYYGKDVALYVIEYKSSV